MIDDIILTPEELNVLENLQDNLRQTDILRGLKLNGLIYYDKTQDGCYKQKPILVNEGIQFLRRNNMSPENKTPPPSNANIQNNNGNVAGIINGTQSSKQITNDMDRENQTPKSWRSKLIEWIGLHKDGAGLAFIFFILPLLITYFLSPKEEVKTLVKDKNFLQSSVYDIVDEMVNAEFSKQKIEIRESVMHLYVKDQGYIYDIDDYINNGKNYIAITIAKTLNHENIIKCLFTQDWNRVISKLKKGEKIEYTGEIVGGKILSPGLSQNLYSPLIVLAKCELIKE